MASPKATEKARLRYRSDWRFRLYHLLGAAGSRARRRGQTVEVTPEDLVALVKQQGFACARTGIPLTLDFGERPSPWAPSLDRLSRDLGYVPGNVQIVCAMYNNCKNVATNVEVLQFARAVAANNDCSEV